MKMTLKLAAELLHNLATDIERMDRSDMAREAHPSDVVLLPDYLGGGGVVLTGRLAGWLVWRHDDGQWVTTNKLAPAETDGPWLSEPPSQ